MSGAALPASAVLAEREACLSVLRACHERLAELLASMGGPADENWVGEPLAIELRRLSAGIEQVELGLHRTEES